MTYNAIEKHNQRVRDNLIETENGPHLLCNWVDFVFIHYEIDPQLLQPEIPYDLHLYKDKAYVSLVAFTLEKFRFSKGGKLAQWITAPVATHQYFNVRTYVQQGREDGIYFMKEWISNLLCAFVGSGMYGLPCHYGKLKYQHDSKLKELEGNIIAADIKGKYQYKVDAVSREKLNYVEKDSLDEFLLERYLAFVKGHGKRKYFRIWHKPWKVTALDIHDIKDELLAKMGIWGNELKPIKAHYSPGVYGVWMGKPQLVR